MHFIGRDLAWSDRNKSAAAAIEAEQGQGKLIDYKKQLESDDDIIDFISKVCKGGLVIVGIDAPIIVPNKTSQRPCDKLMTKEFGRFHAGAHSANQDILGKYNHGKVRGEELLKRLEGIRFSRHPHIIRQGNQERRVIEVYPHPATITLFGLKKILKYKERKGREIEDRQKELGRLQDYIRGLRKAEPAIYIHEQYFCETKQLRGSTFKAHEDFLDAILCAYIVYHAWYWGEQGDHGYKIFGDPEGGYILVPNYKFWLTRVDRSLA